MPVLRDSQCLRHPDRSAVARCRSCAQAFCRECVVEHEYRLMCADCLRREAGRPGDRAGRVPWAALAQWVSAVCVVWVMWYGVASAWRRVPSAVHDGLIWQKPETNDP
jgi:hypothetical protein